MRGSLVLAAAVTLDALDRPAAVAVGPDGSLEAAPSSGGSDDEWTTYATRAPRRLAAQLRASSAASVWPFGTAHAPQFLHVLSMGRVGSSFFAQQLKDAGVATVFEPFNGAVEGRRTLHDDALKQRLACLYSVGPCSAGLLGADKQAELDAAVAAAKEQHGPLGIKTTRVHDFAQVNEFMQAHPELKDAVRYVLMLRDPRGVWASTKPYTGWAIHSIDYVCAALREELDTLPQLQVAVGTDNVKVAMFESWSRELPAFLKQLSAFYGFASEPEAWLGYEAKDESVREWEEALTRDEITEVESNADCKEYMAKVGYQAYTGEPTAYDNLLADGAR